MSEPLWTLTWLVVAMTTKHYVADFLLQTNWIAQGKECRSGWGAPLLLHVLGHAVLTLAIALVVAPRLWWLAVVDFGIHFAVDRSKALLCLRHHWTPQDKRFWWILGLDQYLHQLTNILIAVLFVAL